MNRYCIKCPMCGHPIDAELYNRGAEAVPCPACKTKLTVHALPALYRHVQESTEALLARLDDAACFYHAGKKAEQVCDDCGRFLCGLCVLPFEEETLCATCLEHRRKSAGMHTLKPNQIRHDKLALMLAIVSVIIMIPFWFTVVIPLAVALAGVFVAIRYWKRRPGLAGGYRLRMVFALLLCLSAAVGSVFFALFMFRSIIDA
jgi:hypothetical protein